MFAQVIIILLMNRYSTMASMQGLHTRTYWYKERHQRLYNQGDAYIALQLVEACIAPAFGVALYLSIWVTVGWGWNAQGNLAEALVLVICLVQVRPRRLPGRRCRRGEGRRRGCETLGKRRADCDQGWRHE